MDTECVRLFVLAVEKMNISAAGRHLGMAPAVASAKLAKLENTLGVELLHRSTRKVSLSLDGADFLPYAKEILAQENAARVILGLEGTIATGTLRFAAPSSFAQLYIAPLLPEFLELHPGISLDLKLSDTQFDLIEGSFDLALRNSALEDTSLKGRKLADDKRILCASPEYLAQNGTPLHPRDLANHQLIAFKDKTTKSLIGQNGEKATFGPTNSNCRLVVDDGCSHKIATLAGAGISTNSIWNIHKEIMDGSLIRVLPEFELNDDTVLWLFYPKSNVLTAKVRIFIDFLLEKIGRTPVWDIY